VSENFRGFSSGYEPEDDEGGALCVLLLLVSNRELVTD
jgi:hypothetical protein